MFITQHNRCDVKLWDMIPDGIQRSVTKVKFKLMLKSVIL